MISEDDALRMVEEMPKKKGVWIKDDREREKAYKQAINEGDYESIMDIMVGLFERRKTRASQGKRQTELDDRIFRNTRKVFFGELAVVLHRDIEGIEEELLLNA